MCLGGLNNRHSGRAGTDATFRTIQKGMVINMSNSEQTTKAKQTAEKPKLTPEQREAQRKQALDDAAKKAV